MTPPNDPATSIELQEDLAFFFSQYADAVSRQDRLDVSENWAIPAMAIADGDRKVFESRDIFNQTMQGLFLHYKSLGFEKISKKMVRLATISFNVYVVIIECAASNSKGEKLAEWTQTYMLQKFDDQWKIVMTIADDRQVDWSVDSIGSFQLIDLDDDIEFFD